LLQRGISRTLKARDFLDILDFCGPSPPDCMHVVSGTARGALAIFFASHESSFRVSFDCYKMAAHRVLGLTQGHASHVRKCPRCNESLGALRVSGSSSTTSSDSMSGERTPISMIMDHIPRCSCSHYVIRLHNLIVDVLEEFMAESRAIEGRDLGLEVRRFRSWASRDCHGYVAWLDFAAPHKHLVVNVTVTNGRMNSNVPAVGASLPQPGSLAMGAQQAKLDADLRTSFPLGTPYIQSVYDYYPFAREDGGGWLLWRLPVLIAWPFWWQFDDPQTWVRRTLAIYRAKVMPA
jgi:hypothetical protein